MTHGGEEFLLALIFPVGGRAARATEGDAKERERDGITSVAREERSCYYLTAQLCALRLSQALAAAPGLGLCRGLPRNCWPASAVCPGSVDVIIREQAGCWSYYQSAWAAD